MPSLEQITIYPIKSCSGINLISAEVQDRGFPLDRRWVLIDTNGNFFSQRKVAELSLVTITMTDKHLKVSSPGHDALMLPIKMVHSERVDVQIWKDTVNSWLVSTEADEWFSQVLQQQVRLVHMDRDVNRKLVKKKLTQEKSHEVSFADGYPYLLTNQASLDDLNSRLDQAVGMDRFRQNIVVSGFEAFAEDHWNILRIGAVDFQVVKPCARCQVTTINQQTGISSKEPLKTLATYRNQDGKVMFGMNLVALSQGTIKINAPVQVVK